MLGELGLRFGGKRQACDASSAVRGGAAGRRVSAQCAAKRDVCDVCVDKYAIRRRLYDADSTVYCMGNKRTIHAK